MANKKLKVVAKIERDAQNFFFVKMLYGYTNSQEGVQTVYAIKDKELLEKLIYLSHSALIGASRVSEYGNTIIIYDVPSKCCYNVYRTNYAADNKIIVGTTSRMIFSEINYLLHIVSKTIEKEEMGEFFVQYKDEVMTIEEFYEFQDKLRIYNIV